MERHLQAFGEAACAVAVVRRAVGEKQRLMACPCYAEELLAVLRQATTLQPAIDKEVIDGHQQEDH